MDAILNGKTIWTGYDQSKGKSQIEIEKHAKIERKYVRRILRKINTADATKRE